MTSIQKRKLLIFISAGFLVLLLLGIGMNRLQFQHGLPLPQIDQGKIVTKSIEDNSLGYFEVNDFIKIIIEILIITSVIFLVYKFIKGISKEDVAYIIKWLATLVFALGATVFLILVFLPKGTPSSSNLIPMAEPAREIRAPLGSPPALLFWIVGIILLICSIVVGIWTYYSTRHKNKTFDTFKFEAEKAREDILSGSDIHNVIIRCYRQMSLALEDNNGIERSPFMTPREFELNLGNMGFPPEPIHQLTQLFEVARYSHDQIESNDENKALDCLGEIVHFCMDMEKISK